MIRTNEVGVLFAVLDNIESKVPTVERKVVSDFLEEKCGNNPQVVPYINKLRKQITNPGELPVMVGDLIDICAKFGDNVLRRRAQKLVRFMKGRPISTKEIQRFLEIGKFSKDMWIPGCRDHNKWVKRTRNKIHLRYIDVI